MHTQEALKTLGLSKNEAAVYGALMKMGACQAGPLVKETGLHREIVYQALASLEAGGLVTRSRAKSAQVFQANNPIRLQQRLDEAARQAKELMPSLQRLFQEKQAGIEVQTFFGREGLITNLYEVLDSAAHSRSKEVLIMGGAGTLQHNVFEIMGEEAYLGYVRATQAAKVKKRLLAPPAHEALYREQYTSHKGNSLRLMDDDLTTPSYLRITDDLVSIELYQQEILVLQIRHALIAKSYRDWFEALWKRAQKV